MQAQTRQVWCQTAPVHDLDTAGHTVFLILTALTGFYNKVPMPELYKATHNNASSRKSNSAYLTSSHDIMNDMLWLYEKKPDFYKTARKIPLRALRLNDPCLSLQPTRAARLLQTTARSVFVPFTLHFPAHFLEICHVSKINVSPEGATCLELSDDSTEIRKTLLVPS